MKVINVKYILKETGYGAIKELIELVVNQPIQAERYEQTNFLETFATSVGTRG